MGRSQPVLEYSCPRCGAAYNTLQASALIDFRDGQFHCEHCRAVLVAAEALGAQGGQSTSARRERAKAMRELQVRPRGPALMSDRRGCSITAPWRDEGSDLGALSVGVLAPQQDWHALLGWCSRDSRTVLPDKGCFRSWT